MNENMNGQFQQPVQPPVEPVVQQPIINQPIMHQQIQSQPQMQQPNPTTPNPTAPTFNMNDVKTKISNIDKDKAMKYVGIACGVLMIIALFVPYVKLEILGYTTKMSIWDEEAGFDMFKYIVFLAGLIPIGTYFLQKGKSLSLISAGISLGFVILMKDGLGNSGVTMYLGIWFMLLSSIGLIALNMMENMVEYKSIIMKKAPATPVAAGIPIQTFAAATPVIPVAPVVQSVPVCNNCGQPKKNPNDQFCQSCGQRY